MLFLYAALGVICFAAWLLVQHGPRSFVFVMGLTVGSVTMRLFSDPPTWLLRGLAPIIQRIMGIHHD